MSIVFLTCLQGNFHFLEFPSLRGKGTILGPLPPLLQIFRSADHAKKLGDSLKISVAVGLFRMFPSLPHRRT